MSVRNLDAMFHPRSVAVIGASERRHSIGAAVMRNLVHGGFAGSVYSVNPKHRSVFAVHSYASIAALPQAADLAIICTPPRTIPKLIDELGQHGTRAAIVLTAGLDNLADEHGRPLHQAMLDAARPHLLRILGPDSVGMLIPGIGLNASFAHTDALKGNIAFISQSSSLVTGVLDWAKSRRIGFSHFISLGEAADIDFADLIDYLGIDGSARAVLLYIESLRGARKFLTAARAAARNKPIIVVKAGRAAEGARAATTHTGALAGSDAVFDAAIRRAGMLRVDTMLDLFAAVETLAHITRLGGDRLAILTNGGGAGVMAADALSLGGAKLAELTPQTLARLDEQLHRPGTYGNPLDISGDAPPERYVEALQALGEDAQTDAVLFIHAPTAIVPSVRIAEACAPVARGLGKPVLGCWLGQDAVKDARRVFHEAGIADYGTPEEAVGAFLQLVTYRRNQDQLLETPTATPEGEAPQTDVAAQIVARVLDTQRNVLTEPEAKAVLAAYGIPVVQTRIATSPQAAAATAEVIGFPVAIKILSPDITHKSDVGGVALNLTSADHVRAAAAAMAERLAVMRPEARLTGYTVQQMIRRPGAQELIAGIAVDPMFGPVILFGHGGTGAEVIDDRAVALPPLSTPLARELVGRTRVARLLAGYRDRPAADMNAIYATLTRLSQLLIDLPEVVELDINPLLADEHGVIALDARMQVAPRTESGYARLAIRPYPRELEERVVWSGRDITLRPIKPEDTRQHLRFLQMLSPHDIRMRVFHTRRYIAPAELARLTQIDYEREMAFIATSQTATGAWETLGVVRAVTDPENEVAEYGIIVRSDIKGGGLGRLLFEKVIRYCRSRGTRTLIGDVLRENSRMLDLTKQLGFEVSRSEEPGVMHVRLDLQRAAEAIDRQS